MSVKKEVLYGGAVVRTDVERINVTTVTKLTVTGQGF